MTSSSALDFLLSRTSAPIQSLKLPGPGDEDIAAMLKVAVHVPDHGRLTPWRFVVYKGASREAIGNGLMALAEKLEGPLPDNRREKERSRFLFAPVVIGVVFCPKPHPKIPEWEMFLSAGAVATSLTFAAHGLGFGANWLTGWFTDLPEGRALLGLQTHERIAGLIHIGSIDTPPVDRPRPDPAALTSAYAGPVTA